MNLHELAGGPFVWTAFSVFIAGLAFNAYRFFKLTREAELDYPPSTGAGKPPKGLQERLGYEWDRAVQRFKRSVFHMHPIMSVVTLVFHVLLLLVPIFLLAHNELLRLSIGFGLPAMPDALSDALTLVVLACLAVFLFRRLFLARVRVITTGYDYLVLAITAAPFVTGFLAYHEVFDYRWMLTAHMLSGEVMLVTVPFTRLGHALFFFFYRFFLPGEHSFGRGSRRWALGAAAGPRKGG